MTSLLPSRSIPLVVALVSLATIACGGGEPPPDDAGVHPRFELAEAPLDFGAIPFPEDLYLENGGIELGRFPSEDRADPTTIASLRQTLRELDGFGVVSPVFVPFDGAIDPGSLPASPGATVAEDASVFVVDADPASPSAFQRVPVVVRWNETERWVSMQPVDGRPFVEGRRYAAVVTTRVLAADGAPIEPHPRFAAIRDATERPADPLEARAYDEHAPVLATLGTNGTPRDEIAALAVFTVQSVGRTLSRAREDMLAAPLPELTIERVLGGADLDALLGTPETPVPGGDVAGGVLHEHVAWVIDATFPTRELASPSDGVHAWWELGADGSPMVRREDTAWMTLVLPAGVDLASVPVVVYQHGLGGHRGDVFTVADTLCAAGFAVAAIDIPYHGMRAAGGATDAVHRYGDASGPDLFGDVTGEPIYLSYFGITDTAGPLVDFHPFYIRDVLRQSVLDLMTLARVLDEADLAAAVEAGGGPTFTIAEGPIGFVGVSLGGILGTVFVANEPAVGASLLSVTGGHLARLVENSGSFGVRFLGILLPRLGLEYEAIDWAHEPASARPEIAIFQTLLDRGDSMSHAARLGARELHVLMHMAKDDETVPNVATEGLAAAIGMPMIGDTPRFTTMETATLPVIGGTVVGTTELTRGLVVWDPASHGMLGWRAGDARFEHPVAPPFEHRDPVLTFENPVDAAQAQMARFFVTWREGLPEIADAL